MRYLETILVVSVGLLAPAFKEIKYELMNDNYFVKKFYIWIVYVCKLNS